LLHCCRSSVQPDWSASHPVVDTELTSGRLGQEGLARAARFIQENAILNYSVLFESLGMKPILYDRADPPLLLVHAANVGKRSHRDVGPSGLAVLAVTGSPSGSFYTTTAGPMSDHEDQAPDC
jgi:hypothetical protein